MTGLSDTLRRELRAAGPGEALAAALLVSAFYLEPVFGSAPWLASLTLTCLAGGVLVVMRPASLRRVPLVLVAYFAVYALALLVSGFGAPAEKGSEIARYLVRPAAIGALTLFLVSPGSRRRVLGLIVLLLLPQALVTAGQSIKVLIEFGGDSRLGVDEVTGTFGASEASTVGLVAMACLCLVAGLAFARVLEPRIVLALVATLLAITVFTSTRAAVVFIPLVAVALAAGTRLALGKRAPGRALAVALAIGALAVPFTYLGTEALYPDAFAGALSNQQTLVLEGGRVVREGGDARRDGRRGPEYRGPRGIALLPGRTTQLKDAVRISTEDGPRVFLFGRGFGAASVPEDAVPGQLIPKERLTGVTWVGRVLGDAGWLGLLAFFGLIGWLALLGLRVSREPASGSDLALGLALAGFAALTLIGGAYTTILDVRSYSAVFIVVGAVGFAAARDSAAASGEDEGRRTRTSTRRPPREQSIPGPARATGARSS